jgi:hypothetical protein
MADGNRIDRDNHGRLEKSAERELVAASAAPIKFF